MAATRCVQARSAEDALDIIRQSPPELMLLDLILPGMDGVQLVQQLHEADLRVPFAVVTAATQTRQAARAEDLACHEGCLKNRSIAKTC